MQTSLPSHSSAACMRLLSRFMVDLDELRPLACFDDASGSFDNEDRSVIERVACALWGVFSHHRAVVDGEGRHYDLGSWRAAAELIADAANQRYPRIDPPIRYMDCYMGVLLGEERRVAAQPLYRWIFSRLKEAGCDWIYTWSPEQTLGEQRPRLREQAEALTRAYDENGGSSTYAPLPTVVECYRIVYGRMPDGWPA